MELILPGRSGIPTLSTDPVTAAIPGHGVPTCILIGVGDGGAAVGPEGVVVPPVVAGAARCAGASGKQSGIGASVLNVGSGGGEDASGSDGRKEERVEGNHDDVLCWESVLEVRGLPCFYTVPLIITY